MPPRPTRIEALAATVTDALNPFVLFTALYALVASSEAGYPRALLYIVVELAAAGAVAGYVLMLRRRSQVEDFWISRRAERLFPAAVLLLVFAGLLAALYALGAPDGLLLATLSMAVASALSAAVTFAWKISAHSAVAGHAAAAGLFLLGPLGLLFVCALPVVLWARVFLKAHTPQQALAGAALGALCALAILVA
jgi:membrane-associated phospholipid phosphatase